MLMTLGGIVCPFQRNGGLNQVTLSPPRFVALQSTRTIFY